ncbi:MAG: ferredoxin [Flavobacteriaceae bacterium]|nr:ferredoxin [Flavobacteriaceae bacterium]
MCIVYSKSDDSQARCRDDNKKICSPNRKSNKYRGIIFILQDEISIKVIDRKENIHILKIPTDMGLNLMEALRAHEMPVEGICGGIALCASCQCYVRSNHNLENKSEDEEAMLAEALNVRSNSRLTCQIKVSSKLNGLEIKIAPND